MTANSPTPETSRLKDPSLFSTKLVIGSQRLASHSNRTFPVLYPGDRSITIATIPESNSQGVNDAIASCHATFQSYSQTTARQRSDLLRKLHDLTLASIDDLATIIVRENGKTRAEAVAEVKYAASFLSWFANLAELPAYCRGTFHSPWLHAKLAQPSPQGVRVLSNRQAKHPYPPSLSSNSYSARAFQMGASDIDKAVSGVLMAKLRTSGQTCVAANRILVQSGIYDAFLAALTDKFKTYKQGDGEDPTVHLGPLISERAVEKCRTHVQDALSKGARLHYGPHPPSSLPDSGGYFYPPTILTSLKANMLICTEETFGPVAAIRSFDTEQEAVQIANDSEAGLGAYVFTNDLRIAARMSTAIETGMIGINTGFLSACESPFGGIKESGFGREGSIHGLAEYQIMKTVTTDIS